jgi:hypothetical protein
MGRRLDALQSQRVDRSRLLDDAMLSFELQGRAYRVAAEQHWPSTPAVMNTSAAEWLESALARGRR